MFFTNHNVKKDFKQLIENINFIFKEASECLRPCINVYYHYDLSEMGLVKECINVEEMNIKLSLVAFVNYFSQLITLKNKIVNMFNSNHRVLCHMEKEYEIAIAYPDSVLDQAKLIAKNIKNFKDFRRLPDLVLVYDALVKCIHEAKDIMLANTTIEV